MIKIPRWLPHLLFGILVLLALFPVLIVKRPYKITPSTLKQGQFYILTTDYCKLLPLPAKFQIVYVGDLNHPTPERYSSNAKIGCHVENFQFQIPRTLPPGAYKVELLIDYPPFLRTFIYRSEWITVVENNEEGIDSKLDVIITILKSWDLDVDIEE